MEGDIYEGAVSFLQALDEQLPTTESSSKAYQTSYRSVIDTLAPEVRENYARYQKLDFYRKYVSCNTEPLALAYNGILARMVAEKADKVASIQAKANNK